MFSQRRSKFDKHLPREGNIMAQQQEVKDKNKGKHVPKNKSSEEHAAALAAAKARKNRSRSKKGGGQTTTPIFDLIRQDQEEAAAQAKAERENAIAIFQHRQAIEALNRPSITHLDGLAKEVAEATIRFFPDASAEADKSKTKVAYEMALLELGLNFGDRTLQNELSRGRHIATQALAEAFKVLQSA